MSAPDPPTARRRTPSQPRVLALADRWRENKLAGYGVAVATSGLALLITYWLQVELQRAVFVLFFLAVGITSWFGGLGPSLVAIAIAIIEIDYYMIPPLYAFGFSNRDQLAPLFAFAVVSTAISWLATSQRRLSFELGDQAMLLQSQNEQLVRNRDAQLLLSEASEALGSSLDYRKTLATVAAMAVRDVADWCSVAIGDESGRYENLAVAHRDPERVRWVEDYERLNPPRFDSPTGVPQVLRTGQPEIYPHIDDTLLAMAATTEEERRVVRELGLHSAIIVPMKARGRVIGAITLVSAESRRSYGNDDLWFAERLANRAAYAVDNARLFEEAMAARAEAESANAAKAQFLASMSHELRTPLNAIAGYAELLELGVLGPVSDKQTEALGRLRRSRQHLTTMVDQVLNFARIEAGRVDFDIRDVALCDALVHMRDLIGPQAAARAIEYTLEDCGPDLRVRADRDRLDQIMLNLVGNAVKFTPSGGSIRVIVHPSVEKLRISVQDSGPGIPADKHEMIFQPFIQLAATAEASGSGVGLGLAISRDLARAMGGDITVESSPGHGSTFTVTLPRSR